MIRISDENAALLQQAYALLENVEVKGHANLYALAGAMDRIKAVFDAAQESIQKSAQRRKGDEPESQEDGET